VTSHLLKYILYCTVISLKFMLLFLPLRYPRPPFPPRHVKSSCRGSGDRCVLPRRDLGQRPSRNRIWCFL